MKEIFKIALEKYIEYQGVGLQMTIFWLSTFLLFLEKKKNQSPVIREVVRYSMLAIAIFFFPVSAGIIMKYCIGDLVYWRMLWLLPEVIVLAYFFTNIITKSPGKFLKGIMAVACIGLIVFQSVAFWDYIKPTKDVDWSGVPKDIVETVQVLRDSQDALGEKEIRVVVPDDFITYIRQYDATIKMPYGRDALMGQKAYPIYDYMQSFLSQPEMLCHWFDRCKCNYFVYPQTENDIVEQIIQQTGFTKVGQVNQYNIFHYTSLEREEWEVITRPDASGNQGLFYTLYNAKSKKLIVIDGGWAENTDAVRNVIKSYGNKVDAWFITHYHKDHVSAFNEIYANPNGIKIKKVYAPNYDYDYFKSVAEEWDDFESYEQFLAVTKNADNIRYLERDDLIKFRDLRIRVLNSYDQLAVDNSKDIGNDGGLMLRIRGKQKTMLLCSDVHSKSMSKILLNRYKNKLKVDYVQLAHHGNNSLPTKFYDKVDSEVAIFDAPQWLMTDEQFTAKELQEYFIKKGVTTWDYSTGLHIIYL